MTLYPRKGESSKPQKAAIKNRSLLSFLYVSLFLIMNSEISFFLSWYRDCLSIKTSKIIYKGNYFIYKNQGKNQN